MTSIEEWREGGMCPAQATKKCQGSKLKDKSNRLVRGMWVLTVPPIQKLSYKISSKGAPRLGGDGARYVFAKRCHFLGF